MSAMARATDPTLARLAATHVVRTLRAQGRVAYFAGGCVRDALLGLRPTDFDVATDAPPKLVRQVFPRTAEVGAAFGVILVHVHPNDYASGPGQHSSPLTSVEVATFRSDGPYSDARRPDSITFSDAEHDAQRRDFTVNALFLDPLAPADPAVSGPAAEVAGRVIDFVGGRADLKSRTLRAVGDADKRLAEDHLRALRAVRFAARLGFTIEPATAAAIRRSATSLTGVSRERIGDEVRRMLAHPSRGRAVTLLQELLLDAPTLTEPHAAPGARLVMGLPPSASAMTTLAAWTLDRHRADSAMGWLSEPQVGAAVARLRYALSLSNGEMDELDEVLRTSWAITQRWSRMRVAERKRLAARLTFQDSLDIVRISDPASALGITSTVAALAGDGIGISPQPLVTGDDLIADGLTPSPRFRGILDQIRDGQLEGSLTSREQAMELARRLSVQP